MTDIISIYTDGSCHTQHRVGGWAAILLIGVHEIVLKGSERETTHNRMELQAVIKAFDYLEELSLKETEIRVYSDSQYVVRIRERKEKLKANEFMTKSGNVIQNKDLVLTLISYIESLNIQFIKVKAHQRKTDVRNINREVDMIARKIVRDYIKTKLT